MNNNLIGKYGELLARRYIRKIGYKIVSKNFKTQDGEIDLIAKDNNTYVFIEVKTKKNAAFAKPFENVNMKKRQRLIKTALMYLKELAQTPSCRFDIISITLNNSAANIEHLKDVFEAPYNEFIQ
ncbi:endonuclease [Candidatus Magnetoovum chiemensis]|nr:endonuclease [Candidatus Magnetoovum chiemensis]